MKRPITQTRSREVLGVLGRMSKAALADLVIDLMRRDYGEQLDGSDLAAVIREDFRPIACIRGDKVP